MKPSKQVVSLFMLTGIGLFIALVIAVGIKSKVFSEKRYFYTLMADAQGLIGDPILTYKGLNIGRFDQFELTNSSDIKAEFYVYEKYAHLVTNSSVIVRSHNILLTDVASFTLRQTVLNSVPLQVNEEVHFHTSAIGQHLLKASNTELESDKLASLIRDLTLLINDLRVGQGDNETTSLPQALTQINLLMQESTGLVQQLNESNFTQSLNITVSKANTLLDGLQSKLGQVDSTLSSVENTLKAYQSPESLIDHATDGNMPLLLDSTQKNMHYIEGILEQVHNERQHIGLLMLQSNKALQDLNKTLKAVKANPLLKSAFPLEVTEPQIEVDQ
ncbi:hypothetical protein [Algibacillus agarilyticus]|uniref:hypothetical protein n=1 Tax=Algibacillus agarilyticus TaxID=2234133 RepID=UPI000DD0C2F8|nr:hypothetical protein [Algibacillus agarilyticus]